MGHVRTQEIYFTSKGNWDSYLEPAFQQFTSEDFTLLLHKLNRKAKLQLANFPDFILPLYHTIVAVPLKNSEDLLSQALLKTFNFLQSLTSLKE